MVILARISQQLNESLGGLKKRLRKSSDTPISSYLHPELILFFNKDSRNSALEEMCLLLSQKGIVQEKEGLFEALIARENKVSTGIGLGIALPHAKSSEFEQFFITVGIQKEGGLEWDSLDGSKVKVIFLILGPDNRQMQYLKILSSLTMAIKNETLRKQLFKAQSAQEIIALFEGY